MIDAARIVWFGATPFVWCGVVHDIKSSRMILWSVDCQAPSVIGTVLGQVGPVSVYCD